MEHFLIGSNFIGFLKNNIIHVFSDDGTYRTEKLHEFYGTTLFVMDNIWFDLFEDWKTTYRHPDEHFEHLFNKELVGDHKGG